MTDHTVAQVDDACAAAGHAAAEFGDLTAVPLTARAAFLRGIADRLDEATGELIALAAEETGLAADRLTGEMSRTTGQLRLFADVVEDGGFLDIVIEEGDPALYRLNRPIGPVAVYAASNFPFAFSVAGGDTATALAAGCPVVVKAHPGHPRTSRRTAELVRDALNEAPVKAPEGTFAMVEGFEAGRALVQHPAIKAAAFTGSTRGGRALYDLASGRPDPIPFYGELGSVNPVFVTPSAVRERADEIARGFTASFTNSSGQLCTKPGLLFLPAGHGFGDTLNRLAEEITPRPLLTSGIQDAFAEGLDDLAERPGVSLLAGRRSDGDPAPAVFSVPASELTPELWEEHFGPATLIVEYDTEEELLAAASAMPGSLTATVHAEPEDDRLADALLDKVRDRAGRIVFNGWPTGVAVTAAMHHGGPWPATTAPSHTSVGTAAIRRFLVPVVYQNVPVRLLPAPLKGRS
ncbi:aldehyde dehydrogenase (NADP(+)) [Actinomadura rudentiformis]|uniref:Aldehyde dehydrogenase (NADP(+)) n=1 Tax=Actinomadura rudentiformis TaxID=359158 RepID=A0A6H9YZC8_9ACTN|nr:aldehyde dehydrogenase (NADP(+)) [Actinomadura rudentiformis]KAB2349644.1 aldehyde dehydrogenase (NADP(+)) [Actinomadura rudentiformis]